MYEALEISACILIYAIPLPSLLVTVKYSKWRKFRSFFFWQFTTNVARYNCVLLWRKFVCRTQVVIFGDGTFRMQEPLHKQHVIYVSWAIQAMCHNSQHQDSHVFWYGAWTGTFIVPVLLVHYHMQMIGALTVVLYVVMDSLTETLFSRAKEILALYFRRKGLLSAVHPLFISDTEMAISNGLSSDQQ